MQGPGWQAPKLDPHIFEWGPLVDLLSAKNVKFELRDPHLV
jgi:hypothetical protein